MQKLTLLLTTTLSFLLLIPSQKSSFADNCSPSINAEKSSVECWLKINLPKTLKFSEKQLESAHSTVWNWDKPQPLKLKTDVSLQQLAPVSSEELKERGLNSDESGYKGVTWMSDGFAKQAQAVKDHQQGTLKLNQYIWITPASQTQPFCRTCKGSLSNSNIPEIINLRLRLIQYLGLILKDSDKSHFVTIVAKKSDIIRPCLVGKIEDDKCSPPQSQQERTNFMKKNPNLIGEAYPWTALGYTYDWGRQTENVGASEYVIKPNATVFIESVKTTKDFCQR